MGLRPAFSASVYGMISRASANALKQYASAPVRVLACSISSLIGSHVRVRGYKQVAEFYLDTSVSGAPPPAMRNLFLTKHLMTQRAS